ncbi:MAG: hypothetical protein ACRCT8_04940 [Lacipirellulaceae bacterium]
MTPIAATDDATLGPWLAAAGVALLTTVLLRRLWRRSQAPTAAPIREPCSPAYDSHAELERQKVELHELARDATARIDTKLALLDELIRQSDARAAELRSLLEKQQKNEPPMDADERG